MTAGRRRTTDTRRCELLVLSRQRGESIIIGDDIEVTAIDVCGGKVKIGIKAPKDVRVDRLEVRDAIRREARCAAPQEG